MSERKVITKYFPPDFDPSAISRTRHRGPKTPGPKHITVRLMSPFSMQCTACGGYIYKGRKFNARKETAEERYLNSIPIYRFYIRCTRCSAEIVFRTDPKNMDYCVERGAKRNFEAWREERVEETDEQRLDRLEKEEAVMNGTGLEEVGGDKMEELEKKTYDAKKEMEIADALDEIRSRNARLEAKVKEGMNVVGPSEAMLQAQREEAEDAEAARRAFQRRIEEMEVLEEEDGEIGGMAIPVTNGAARDAANDVVNGAVVEKTKTTVVSMSPPSFKPAVRKKKDLAGALGIKKKSALV